MGKRVPSIYESRPCPQLREQNPDLASQLGRLRRASAKAPRPSVEMVQSKTGLTAWGRHSPDSSQGEISPSSTSFGLPSAEGAASGKPVHFSVALFEMDRSQSPSTPNVMHALKARLYAHGVLIITRYFRVGNAAKVEKLEACIKDKAVPDANNAALIIKHLLDAAALCLYVILQQSLRCVEELRKEK
ncbi:hypothetical protein CFAM422_009849 [Trichoderma lentiforme]|uniref:Uncharacterized protein n=1 Tax=Trichoderma lentiforme TaxID=1567552 RepID=A0A9P5C8M5_9HYPO|nr:hypothetical protein CFAM422_009849 [Trichoderma lentiforme]